MINRTTKKRKWVEKQFKTTNKRDLKTESESSLIAAKNNAIMTNCVKEKIDKTEKIAFTGYVVLETN